MFHDGSPVTAEDVVFSPSSASWTRRTPPCTRGFIPFIESRREAADEQTVTFTLAHPSALLAERLSVVKIVPQAAVEADPEAFDADPVGTGPWVMTDNGAASMIVEFERNEDYTGPMDPSRPGHGAGRSIPDASTRTNAMQSESVQAIDSVPYLSIDQLDSTHTVESVPGFGLLFAMFNNAEDNPFNDVRNRQAFLYAIDIDAVIDNGLSGEAEAPTSFLHADHPNHQEASTVYTMDQAKAEELFAETGLTSFRMMVTDHDWVQQVTPIIQESLTAVRRERGLRSDAVAPTSTPPSTATPAPSTWWSPPVTPRCSETTPTC